MEIAKTPARLVIREGDNSRTINIDSVPFTIGRQPDNSLHLPNMQISRRQCVIHKDDAGYFIEDLGSRHGTLINGIRRETAHLRSGDRIQLGLSNITLLFLTTVDQPASTLNLFTMLSTDSGSSELEKLSLFLQAAQSFNNTRVLQDILSTMLQFTLRLTSAERGFVFLGDNFANLTLETGLNSEGQPLLDDSKISRSILQDAAQSGQEFLIGDVSGEGQPIGRESIVAHELRSVIAIPLHGRASRNLLGVLYLDSHIRTSTLNRVGRDILHAIATEAATLVENARMMQAQRAAELLRNELEIAASIQQSIIPSELPVFPYAKLSARTVQSADVGGDFYDVIPIDHTGQAGFVAIVADVSGKGMAAALLAAIIHGMMYAQVKSCASLVDAVSTVHDFLCSRVSGRRYATLIALSCDPSGRIELVNGGHVSPFLIHEDGSAELIRDGDLPVGLLPNANFHSVTLTLPPRSRLVLLSDGITETEDPTGEQFGTAALANELAATDPVLSIFTAMHEFSAGAPLHDDCTLLVIDRIT